MNNYVVIKINAMIARIGLFLVPLLLLLLFLKIRTVSPDSYFWLVGEDGLVEDATALLYIMAFVASGFASILYLRAGSALNAALFALLALACFFVAGEEISWGQRLLGLETPDSMKDVNVQGEMNIHNLKPVQAYLHQAYILIGFAGATIWMVAPFLGFTLRKLFNNVVVPPWYLMFYFLPVSVFYAVLELNATETLKIDLNFYDQEPPELLLCMGFALLALRAFFLARSQTPARRKHLADVFVTCE